MKHVAVIMVGIYLLFAGFVTAVHGGELRQPTPRRIVTSGYEVTPSGTYSK